MHNVRVRWNKELREYLVRADYCEAAVPNIGEEEKLDRHWTENWESIGNQRRPLWRIKAGPEYPVVCSNAPKPGPGVRVLDGGCGLGEWCLLLKEMGYEPYGLDISTPTVARLQQEFPDMHFVRDDIRQTSFEDGFFDFYISWGTFEHFEDGLQGCFREAHRVLKQGGKLIITVPYYSKRLLAADAANPVERPQNAEFYQWRLGRDELAKEFELGGFDCSEVKPIYRSEGLRRHLNYKYGLPFGKLSRLLTTALGPVVPADYFAHMLIGVGTKRA